MLLHHVVTIILICNSWMIDQMRPGLVVMWVHDVSDTFLFLGRILNDFKLKNPMYFFKKAIPICPMSISSLVGFCAVYTFSQNWLCSLCSPTVFPIFLRKIFMSEMAARSFSFRGFCCLFCSWCIFIGSIFWLIFSIEKQLRNRIIMMVLWSDEKILSEIELHFKKFIWIFFLKNHFFIIS